MDLNPQSWHVRWFFWSLGIWDAFLDNGERGWQMERHGTNLCFFLRTIVLYTPLVLLLHAVVYGAALAALTIVPILIFGASGYFSTVIAITLLVLTVIGVKQWRKHQQKGHQEAELRRPAPVAVTEVITASPRFFQILWEWIVAVEKKVCPMIRFAKRQEAQS